MTTTTTSLLATANASIELAYATLLEVEVELKSSTDLRQNCIDGNASYTKSIRARWIAASNAHSDALHHWLGAIDLKAYLLDNIRL